MKEEARAAVIFVIFLIPSMFLFQIIVGLWLIFSIPLSVIISVIFTFMVLGIFKFKKSSEKMRFIKQILISLSVSVSLSALMFGSVIGKESVSTGIGDYHTIDGNGKQIQYQGSKEQKRDLKAIDDYAKDNPGF